MPNERAASPSPGLPIGYPEPISKLSIDIIRGVQRDPVCGGTAVETADGHQTCAETMLS